MMGVSVQIMTGLNPGGPVHNTVNAQVDIFVGKKSCYLFLNVSQLPRAFGEELKPKPTEGTINYFAPRDWTSRFASS
jgi:hypothetical protein